MPASRLRPRLLLPAVLFSLAATLSSLSRGGSAALLPGFATAFGTFDQSHLLLSVWSVLGPAPHELEATPRGICPLPAGTFTAAGGGRQFAFGMPTGFYEGPVVIWLPGTGNDCSGAYRQEFFATISSNLPSLCVAYDTNAAFLAGRSRTVALSITEEIERLIGIGMAALKASYPGCGVLADLNVGVGAASGWEWERLILSGHSQGAVHAARLSQRHRVGRAIFFSSPCAMFNDELAWMSGPFATPADRLFGLTSVADMTCPWDSRGWNLLFGVNQVGVRRQWARIGITDLLEVNERTPLASYSPGNSHGIYLAMKRAIGCLYVDGHTETVYDLLPPCWYDRKRTWGLLFGWVNK